MFETCPVTVKFKVKGSKKIHSVYILPELSKGGFGYINKTFFQWAYANNLDIDSVIGHEHGRTEVVLAELTNPELL